MFVFASGLNPARDQTGQNINGDNPFIGYNNLVTAANLSSDYALSTNPVTNLANPSTAFNWMSGAGILQTVTLKLTGSNNIDYLAVAGHNFKTAGCAVNAQGWTGSYVIGSNMRALSIPILSETGVPLLSESGSILLSEASISQIGDMTAGGGLAAAFDNNTSQAAASCAQTGAGVTTGYAGSNFSTQAGGGKRVFNAIVFGSNTVGYSSLGAGTSITINLRGKASLPANSSDGTLLGTTGAFSNLANENVGRTITSNDQGTLWAYVWVEVTGSAATLNCAEAQFNESLESWFDLTTAVVPTDNLPMIFWFPLQTALQKIRLQLAATASVSPQAAVMYVGQSLIIQRRIYVGHTPMPYGRNTNIVTGMSESGNYLGRIVLGESRKSSIVLKNLTPAWYRANMEPFIAAAITAPFFFAWRPYSYPGETSYAWLAGDAVPSNALPNGYMNVTLPIGGVAS